MPKGVDQVSELEQADERATDARMRRHGEALRAERHGCPHPELLFASQSEALDADVRDRLEAHVSTCAACRRLVEDVDGLGLAEPDAGDRAARAGPRDWTGRKGSAGLLPLAAGLLWRPGSRRLVVFAHQRAGRGAAHRVSTAPAVAQSPAPPVVALWTVTPAPVRVPLSSLGVPRSGGTVNPDGAVLVAALAPYQSGDYVAATARLSPRW